MDALASLSVQLVRQSTPLGGNSELVSRKVTQVKIRSFTAPGARLQLEVVLQDADAQRARLKVAARSEDKTIATARIEVTPRGNS
jgi:3-hydroxymyristoyl/3-hydroxydecanoyl-(acyl carrier protein) dehydratase